MTTATRDTPAPRTRKPRTVKAPHGLARLILAIDRSLYWARPIPADPGSGVAKMYRLTKAEGDRARYHVARHDDGTLSCDCPSQTWDHDGNPDDPACKHLAAS